MQRTSALRRAVVGGTALAVVGVWSATAPAIINPRFTPVHLVKQSNLILHGRLAVGPGANEWTFAGPVVLKGTATGPQVLSAAAFAADHRAELDQLLKPGDVEVVLFAARTAEGPAKTCVNIDGRWTSADPAGPGRWHLLDFDLSMDGTYAGGADMLARMCRELVDDPTATVPVAAGMAWSHWIPVTKVEGGVSGLAAVTIDGRTCLFVASPAGDHLFAAPQRPAATGATLPGGDSAESFARLTVKAHLTTRSKCFAWADMDLDGQADLVTFDGRAVRLVRFRGGAAEPADASRGLAWEGPCLGLAPAGAGPDGRPRLIASTPAAPRLLHWSPEKGFTSTDLPLPGSADHGGKASACVVADLDGDGFVDCLQPRERFGWLWRGTSKGPGEAQRSGVACPGGGGCAALGDFDGDGSLDVFLSGPGGNGLWENDGKAGFRNVLDRAGSLAYKADYRAAAALATDLNHDGRPDLALGSAEAGFVYHFSRGCRCFAEQGELRLSEVEEVPVLPSWGVQAMAVADFNADDVDDLAVAFTGGEVHCYLSGLLDLAALRVQLPKGVAGPVTVSAWQGAKFTVCTGTWPVIGGAPRLFSLRERGPCLLRFTLPGQPVASQRVVVETDIPTLTLKASRQAL